MGRLLAGKTVGIVGYGAIGSRVGGLAAAFGAKLAFCDPGVDSCALGATRCCLDDLLGASDIVTLHASGSGCVLGARELALCKSGVIIVNTARRGPGGRGGSAGRSWPPGRWGRPVLMFSRANPIPAPWPGRENAPAHRPCGLLRQRGPPAHGAGRGGQPAGRLGAKRMTLTMTVQAVFFDFDGVLADSVEVKTRAFYRLYEGHGPEVAAQVAAHHRANGGHEPLRQIQGVRPRLSGPRAWPRRNGRPVRPLRRHRGGRGGGRP